ncbi:MAG: radical SAM protein [Synergistaceae bacterium]|nr:radical SAM protein [Synergistaceae bacterium]
MRVLSRCNGEWDFDSILTIDEDRECVKQFISCGFIEPCQEGQGISPYQEYKCYPTRYVSFVHWAITGRCNYKCKHCFMSAPEAKFGELSYDSIMNIIDQLDECGVTALLLTGGEPLVRPDFPEIVKEITRRGMKIQQFYTNGALLNDKVLDCLLGNGHNPLVIMSYDGVGWHDWLRGIPGSEKAVNEALALCKRRGVRTHVQAVFHRKNLHTMRDTVNHLAAMGCESTRLGIVNEQGDWIKNKDDNTLTMQEFIEAALEYIPLYYEDGMPIPLVISSVFSTSPQKPDSYAIVSAKPESSNPDRLLFACSRQKLQILPNGRVSGLRRS